MKIKKFNENSEEELPKSIDINIYLDQIRTLRTLQVKTDKGSSEWTADVEIISLVDEIIEKKLQPTLNKYLDNMDYEGAKWFVGRSYKDVITAGKILLFKQILLHQDKIVGKYNL